jgi:hypothetical protein
VLSDVNTVDRMEIQMPPQLTAQEYYAGEILSYLMSVVCGFEGPPKSRKEWKTAGINASLNFQYISEVMKNGKSNKKELIALDANILGLSKILYHYNPRFNLFKTNNLFESMYPSTELVALRLLLLKKLQEGKKMRISAILKRKHLFMGATIEPSGQDLAETGLNRDEFSFFQGVFASEPTLWDYIQHPFILKSLLEMGALEKEPYVTQRIRRATYRECLRQNETTDAHSPYRIAILPSFFADFKSSDRAQSTCGDNFIAPDTYLDAVEKLRSGISESVIKRIESIDPETLYDCRSGFENSREAFNTYLDRYISYFTFSSRPLVVYPGNADDVISGFCSDADLKIILLGKDVYLSIDFEHGFIDFKKKQIYLDFENVRYSLIQEELNTISALIVEKMIRRCGENKGGRTGF